jgi:Arc/MetJ family transcription regulator
MSKHLVDIDEEALSAARARLGARTIKDTVNGALRQTGEEQRRTVQRSLDRLARAQLEPRERAWR